MIHHLPGPDDLETLYEEGSAEIARSYAQALLNASEHEGQAEAVLDEFEELIQDVWKGQPEFAALLSYGLADIEKRDQVIREVFEGRAHPILFRFLLVLSHRNRLILAPLIARTLREMWNRRHNLVPVSVRTARPLDDDLRLAIREKLGSILNGATPILHESVDPDLIGGLVVQIGDQLYDASVRHRLSLFHDDLLKNRIRDIRHRTDLVVE